MKSQSSSGYSRVAITLHWLIAFLIIGQIAVGFYMHDLEAGNKFQLYQLHKSFGIVVLLLSVLRLLWRLGHRPPGLPDGMKVWEIWASKLTHWGFYVLMIATPLMGWMMVSASPFNIPTELFGVVPWPDFPGINRGEKLADLFGEVHEIMAKLIILLLALHVGAALKHHFIGKDDVLTRMIPMLKRRL